MNFWVFFSDIFRRINHILLGMLFNSIFFFFMEHEFLHSSRNVFNFFSLPNINEIRFFFFYSSRNNICDNNKYAINHTFPFTAILFYLILASLPTPRLFGKSRTKLLSTFRFYAAINLFMIIFPQTSCFSPPSNSSHFSLCILLLYICYFIIPRSKIPKNSKNTVNINAITYNQRYIPISTSHSFLLRRAANIHCTISSHIYKKSYGCMLSHQLFSVEYFQLNPKTTKFVKKNL